MANASVAYRWSIPLTTSVTLRYAGPSFDDAANDIKLGGYVLADLRASYALKIAWRSMRAWKISPVSTTRRSINTERWADRRTPECAPLSRHSGLNAGAQPQERQAAGIAVTQHIPCRGAVKQRILRDAPGGLPAMC